MGGLDIDDLGISMNRNSTTEDDRIFYQETFGTDELANKYQIQETKIDQVKDLRSN